MHNVSKMRINKPACDVFEAFVDPAQIGHFWFSSGDARWEAGRTIKLRYEEYDADGEIEVIEIVENEKIVFAWHYGEDKHTVAIILTVPETGSTVVEIVEDGFKDSGEGWLALLVDNKEGWVYMLTCLKAYLEFGISGLRAALVK
ncbi:SRPBCC domain-containing protein [Cohnella sp. 56]|uniref:SRPBCC domain-containing protein n=1 Tax=Cohnella sp. 56 TaxID=3113722 RepID=UPI0030E9DB49